MKKFLLALTLSLGLLFPAVCFGAAATMYVTVAGDGDKDGTSWANAFDLANWETDCEGSAEAGDIYYVAGGTYTLTDNFSCQNDGTAALPIKVIGVTSGTTAEPPTVSDWAYGANRPLIAAGANALSWDDYWIAYNFQVTTTHSNGFELGSYSTGYNNYVYNSSETAGRYAIRQYNFGGAFYFCEGKSTSGIGIGAQNGEPVAFSYAHDSTDCYKSGSLFLISSVADTCTDGVDLVSQDGNSLINNVIYGCTNGINATDSAFNSFINNIIDGNTNGAVWSTANELTNFWDYNIWNNTTDVSNVTKGVHDITGDPGLTAPADGDFTLSSSGSNAIAAAMQLNTNVGVTGAYKVNIGVDQDDNTAAGGGSGGPGWVSMSQ